jgi:hypothetical protein
LLIIEDVTLFLSEVQHGSIWSDVIRILLNSDANVTFSLHVVAVLFLEYVHMIISVKYIVAVYPYDYIFLCEIS